MFTAELAAKYKAQAEAKARAKATAEAERWAEIEANAENAQREADATRAKMAEYRARKEPEVTPSDSIRISRSLIERLEKRIAEKTQELGGEPDYII